MEIWSYSLRFWAHTSDRRSLPASKGVTKEHLLNYVTHLMMKTSTSGSEEIDFLLKGKYLLLLLIVCDRSDLLSVGRSMCPWACLPTNEYIIYISTSPITKPSTN